MHALVPFFIIQAFVLYLCILFYWVLHNHRLVGNDISTTKLVKPTLKENHENLKMFNIHNALVLVADKIL